MLQNDWFEVLSTGNLDAIRQLTPSFVGTMDSHGETGLMKAVRLRNPNLLKLLIPHEKRMKNNRGQTALMLAAHFNYAEGCEMLYAEEGDIFLPSGCCCLIVAAVAQADDALRAILPHHRYTPDPRGATALVHAAERGHLTTVKILLDDDSAGPAPDAVRALIVAVLCEQPELASFLARYLARFISRDVLMQEVTSAVNSSKPINTSPKKHDSQLTQIIDTPEERSLSVPIIRNTSLTLDPDNQSMESPHLISPITTSPQHMRQIASFQKQSPAVNPMLPLRVSDLHTSSTAIRKRQLNQQNSANAMLPTRSVEGASVLSSMRVRTPPSPYTYKLNRLARSSSTHTRIPHTNYPYDSSSAALSTRERPVPLHAPKTSASMFADRSSFREAIQSQMLKSELRRTLEPGLMCGSNSIDRLPGLTALMTVVITGQNNLISHLARQEGGRKTTEGWTALMFAVLYNKLDSLNILVTIEAGLQNNKGETALMIAASNNRTSAIIDLLQRESCIQDKFGRTALIHAVRRGNYEAARMLCDNEYSITDVSGYTAFLYACKADNVKATQLLVSFEGNKTDCDGHTGLMIAAEQNNFEIIRQLVHIQARRKNNAGITALMLAGYHGHTEAASLLAAAEACETNENGATALMIAAMAGSLDICDLLVSSEHGIQNQMGQTALMLAAASNHQDIVSLLMPYESGIQDNEGRTALMYAAESQCFKAVEVLMSHESTLRDSNGCTAMMYAARAGSLDVVRALAQYEERLVDNRGHCALVYSMKTHWPTVVEYLIPLEGDLLV